MTTHEDEFSWEKHPEKMIPGKWYPFPCGAMWINNDKYHFDGWDIFEADPNEKGAIIPIEKDIPRCTLRTAVAICEEHNGFTFEEVPR